MSEEHLLEPIRMCLAEAGYDPWHAFLMEEDGKVGVDMAEPPLGVPADVIWKAFQTVRYPNLPCKACFVSLGFDRGDCLEPGVEDCGAARL